MTCSTSSSASASPLRAALLAAALAGCAGAPPAVDAPRPPRVAVLPLDNLAAAAVPQRNLSVALDLAVARSGADLVTGDIVERFLQAHHVRSTSGVDRAAARAAHDELGVDAILLTSLESFALRPAPRLGLLMRLVSASDEARVLWIEQFTLAGDQSPGLLGLGLIGSMEEVQRRVLAKVTLSLADYFGGRRPRVPPCTSDSRFEPRISYRAPQLEPGRHFTVAVLPFLNESDRRHAGEIVALEFVRQLHALDRFTVVEPGEVREEILDYRLIMEGGISVNFALTLLKLVRADVVIAGTVRDYREGNPPQVNFTALALDQNTERIAWEASSRATGADGVFLFDGRAVKTAGELACRMSRKAAEQLAGAKGRRPPVSGSMVSGSAPGEPARSEDWTPLPLSVPGGTGRRRP